MFLLKIVSVFCCTAFCLGLDCFKCQDVELDSDSSVVKSLIGPLPTNKACASTTFNALDRGVSTETCSSSQVCGFVKGGFSFTVPVFGSVSAQAYQRGCMDSGQSSGCVSDNEKLRELFRFLSKFADVSVNADVCYCDFELCVAGGCGDNQYAIGPICLQKWLAFTIAGGVLLLITACIVCCCCCCCGCCRRQTPGTVIVSGPNPPTSVIHHHQHTAQGYSRLHNTNETV